MKTSLFCPSHALCVVGFVVQSFSTCAVTFTNDTIISPTNTSYEGLPVVVSNCTLTVDGPHAFASLLITAGGTLTHTALPDGVVSNVNVVVDEMHTLADTNPVTLLGPNIVIASIVVTDASKTIVYTNGSDYLVSNIEGGLTTLQRTTNSTIPDGAQVLVSYNVLLSTQTGLDLTVAGNLEIAAGGSINVNGKGYGGNLGPGNGGEAGNPQSGAGAGHGGLGGMSSSNAVGGTTYGSFEQPTDLGSGGGAGYGGAGGAGGGAIKIVAGGTVINNGIISANGADGTNSRSGGGSGGSIWLMAQRLIGSGTITANGGTGEPIHGGGGGGGRIAVQCDTNNFSGSMSAYGGSGAQIGGAGTVFTKLTGQNGLLLLDNGGRAGTNSLLAISSRPDVLIRGNAGVIPSGTWTVGNLTIASNGLLTVVYPATVNLTATGNVTIQAGGVILADSAGSPAGQGTGYGHYFNDNLYRPCGGAGHGGRGASGASAYALGGSDYGSQTGPTTLGSGGGQLLPYSIGGAGGGAIRLTANRVLLVDGLISANGGNGSGSGGGGGSGGSVWLTAGTLVGSGSITANGGNGVGTIGGGGGGGRVAVVAGTNLFSGVISAYGGGGANWGGAGTVFIQQIRGRESLILDNAGHLGTNTPLQSASSSDLIVRNGAIGYMPYTSYQSFASLFIGSNAWLAVSNVFLSFSGNATIQAGGGIVADMAGYPAGRGPGSGRYYSGIPTYPCSGAGYGGYGANSMGNYALGGNAYGYAIDSGYDYPGSGGGSYANYSIGGAGGGQIRLSVGGVLRMDGCISANGGNGTGLGGGGGAGGSIRVSAGTLSGNGLITANGGNGAGSVGGGGGGGRISITYGNPAFSGTISAYGGGGANRGGAGTIYLKQSSQSYGQLILDNGGNAGTNTLFDTSTTYVPVDLLVSGRAVGEWPGSSSYLRNVLIRSNSALTTVRSEYARTLTRIDNLTIEPGGELSLDGKGYSGGRGTGAGLSSSSGIRGGGGHGGFGAANPTNAGGVYGSIVSPSTAGSGGGNGSGSSGAAPYGGAGGGALELMVTGVLTVNGRLSANGMTGDLNSGGGAGGSLQITAGTLTGSGIISANGGSGNGLGGGGGGGRIAIIYTKSSFSGNITAMGGDGYARGGAGTIYLKASSASAGQLFVDNGGFVGTNTPLGSAYSIPASPFDLTIGGGAVVHPATPWPLLGNLTIGPGGLLTCLPGQSNLVLAVLGNVDVTPGGAISVDGKGFSQAKGPGAGGSLSGKGAGGGYGGRGGASASGAPGGTNYGSASQPVDHGSGGGAGYGAYLGGSEGGGAIRLSVGGVLNVDGVLSANGNPGLQDDAGGGAGGSIWITAGAVCGDGLISADGGAGDLYGGGGGGGGRIAIYTLFDEFTGHISVSGGNGANRGRGGTFYYQADLPEFGVVSHWPTGTITNTLSYLELYFSDIISASSVSAADFRLFTPNGPLPQAYLATSVLGLTTVRVSFPQQNLPGDYRIEAGPGITNLYGQPMSQVYTGWVRVVLPTISGTITTTNGLPVAGVILQPGGGLLATTTDTNGNYALGVPPGWSGTVTPKFGNFMFVPGVRAYSNVQASVSDENYLMVDTIAPWLDSGLSGTNLWLRWNGIRGVSYQTWCSTNLTDWFPLGDVMHGTNGLMEWHVPIDKDPIRFFRLKATN